jgi:hypothetical protein
MLTAYLSTQKYNATGFVAVDNRNKLIIASFRGTDPRSAGSGNANPDAKGSQDLLPQYCTNCAGASGYLRAFQEVNTTLINTIQTARKSNPTYQVVTTGHSQGGAIGTFAALELRRLQVPVHAVSLPGPLSEAT